MTKTKKGMLCVSFFSGAILGCYLGVQFLFPLEWSEFSSRVELWRGNVHEVQLKDLHGYLRDSCQPGVGHWSDCSCVALIHGLGDTGMTWKKLLLWPEAKWKGIGLSQAMRILAVDLPGSGKSKPPAQVTDYSVRSQALFLNSSLREQCSEWTLVGNSLGGAIATWMALESPQSVKRLILLAPAGMKSVRMSSSSGLTHPTVESMKAFQKMAYFKPREIPDFVWEKIVKKAEKSNSTQVVDAQTEADDLDLRISTLQMPTLIIWGQADHIIPIEIGKEMRAIIPEVKWREVPECGHLLQKECPLPVIQSIADMIRLGSM